MLHGGICFITDRRFQKDTPLSDIVRMVLDAGIRWVQYREKELPRREIYFTAEMLRKITDEYEATFIVNDHPDIALSVDADGVHLGQDDLPLHYARRLMNDKIVGISTHDLAQAIEAEKGGADYIGFGPIYATTTKENPDPPRGTALLREVSQRVNIPVVAIGGITLSTLPEVLSAGASSVAVASGILKSDQIPSMAGEFVRIVKEHFQS
ncbi:MAG: thiamine phosphate synthase [Nitrospirae bacterium]|nr:MAG: thiamine phosphate synthase [Nitrospirota bacterium]